MTVKTLWFCNLLDDSSSTARLLGLTYDVGLGLEGSTLEL